MSHEVEARLREILLRHGLPQSLLPRYLRLLALLAGPHAPTTVGDPRKAVDVHLADSLEALSLAPVRTAETLVDLGSGAGLPGLPLALATSARVFLVESQARKAEFLRTAAAELGLSSTRVAQARVEDWGAGGGAADVVTARAVAAVPTVLEYAAPLLRVGGTLVDWRAGEPGSEPKAAALLGLARTHVVQASPYPEARHLRLDVYMKVRKTPERFPRRAGMARKRPLEG